MKYLRQGAVGVDQGVTSLFSHYESDGEMWTGTGEREVRQTINFTSPFLEPPAVHLSIALFDLDQETNGRADLAAEKVTETGFEAVFRTWSDTRVARIRVSWLAVGPVSFEDDWDVE